MLTLKMTSIDEGKPLSKDACRSIIERWWSARIINPETIHGMSDGMGVVFDIQNSYYERFLDNYDHIKNQEGLKLDFIVSRCQELPEMEDEESNGGSSSVTTIITVVTVVLVHSAEDRAEAVLREAAAEVKTQREGEEEVKEVVTTTTLRDLVVVMDRENLATTRESR